MDISKRAFFVLLGAFLTSASLFAAGTHETTASSTRSVTVWYPSGEQGTRLQAASVPAFNKAAPGYTLDFLLKAKGDAFRTTLQASLAAGAGPDVIVLDGAAFAAKLASSGLLDSMDSYATEYAWSKLFAPWALNVGRFNNSLYSLPAEMETILLYYNKPMFAQHGWQPPRSIDDLIQLAAKIKSAGIIPIANAFGDCVPCNEWNVTEFLNHWAGADTVYQALTGKVPWTDPVFAAGITKLATLVKNGDFMGARDLFMSQTTTQSDTIFGEGKAAMKIEGTWLLGTMSQYFDKQHWQDWAWEPFPNRTAGGASEFDIGLGSAWAINAASKDPKGAAYFLNWWFQPATQVMLMNKAGQELAPVNFSPDVFNGLDPREAKVWIDLTKANAAGNYGYTTYTFWPPKTEAYLYTAIQKVYEGELTAAEYMKQFNDIFQKERAQGAVPPIPVRD